MADKYLLLVEGKDDEHVFYHLLEHYHVPEQFKIKDKDGVDNLLGTLDVEIEGSGLERLGIVIDADTDIQARWQALRNILIQCGYVNVPTGPSPEGLIIEQDGRPAVGIWIMPDNTLPGMLEHFIGFLVPLGDTLWPRAERCVEQIPEPERRFQPQHQIKAHVHTWLAWQEDPGTPMGQAITKRYLDAEAQHAKRLMGWVRRLFNL
jgi:hypothetical protein